MSRGQEEPSADMRQLARTYRDMYVALIAEGFSPSEALSIMGHVISGAFGGGKS